MSSFFVIFAHINQNNRKQDDNEKKLYPDDAPYEFLYDVFLFLW